MKAPARKQIEELCKIGVDIREAESKKPGYSDGIKKVLTGLYPDNAHFIFELLQNAEDKGATHVNFQLTSDGLIFVHNGPELFDISNVDSITNIGDSTKMNDDTKIGEFGVGFKAVFAYTETPRVYSGDYWFEIRDLICPYPLDETVSKYEETRFEFPFNNKKKNAQQAVAEISKGLQALGDNTLLFLKHIEKIEYSLPESQFGGLERIGSENDPIIKIRSSHPDGTITISHWLRFQKNVEILDDDSKCKACRIAIAYSLLEEPEKKRKGTTVWRIVPLDHGQVSIYFPALGEPTTLRFHMHAPFASNVARTNVRDCDANKCLRDHLGTLVVESLSIIRDRGLLTVGFLAVLPNQDDNLEFYKPIQDAVIKAFKEQNLTPAKEGGYAPSSTLLTGPASISETVKDADLAHLTGRKMPLWAAHAPSQSKREKAFLDNLEIEEWEWSELAKTINWLDDNGNKCIEQWLAHKDDAWIMRYYALLGEAYDTHNKRVYVSNLRIVRVTSDNCGEHVTPSMAFFPPELETSPPSDICFVKPTVYNTGRSESQKKFAASFLKYIGVRYYDAKTTIELKLAHYVKPSNEVDDSYFEDVKQFITYWKKKPTDASIFRCRTFLLGLSEDGRLTWCDPKQLCLDVPYLKTGLKDMKHIHKKIPLWSGYQDRLEKSQLKDFVAFLEATDVMYKFSIIRNSTWKRGRCEQLHKDYSGSTRERNSTDNDYTIDHLKEYIHFRSILCSRLIWEAITHADSNAKEAEYSPNQKFIPQRDDSVLVIQLKNHAWIPDKTGNFRKPQDMTEHDLHTDFIFDDRNGLLTAISFGENAVKQRSEYKQDVQVLSKYNLTPDIAEELGRFSPDEQKELLNNMRRKRQTNTPTAEPLSYSPAPDPARRQQKAQIEAEKTSEKMFEHRQHSVRTSRNPDIKSYLKDLHVNENLNVICQICNGTMPFKIDTVDYFEAVQFVRAAEKEYKSNHLALCPTCAAAYKHACGTSESKRVELLLNLDCLQPEDELIVPLVLPVECNGIRFTQKHLIDLQKAMSEHLKGAGEP